MNRISQLLRDLIDRADIRPRALLFVGACAAFAFGAQWMRSSEIVATGVTDGAERILSTASVAKVSKVHVAMGEHVRAGAVIVSLVSPDLLAERDSLEAEVRGFAKKSDAERLQVMHDMNTDERNALMDLSKAKAESQVAAAEAELQSAEAKAAEAFLDEAKALAASGLIETNVVRERAVGAASQASEHKQAAAVAAAAHERVARIEKELSANGAPSSIIDAVDESHRAELNVLEVQLRRVMERIEALEVRAPIDGIVSFVPPAGTTLPAEAVVARVAPPYAAEVVAFLPAQALPPTYVAKADFSVVLADGSECRGSAVPRSVGVVEAKPVQLGGPLSFDSNGFPLRVTLPDHCRLPVGQVVELRMDAP